jgi:predicted site-specific integrase-resolvase
MMQTQACAPLPRSEIFDRPLVKIVSACLIAGVSRATLYRWIALGKVEVVRTAGGAPRIYADTLLRRIDE